MPDIPLKRILTKRVYEHAASSDGIRILIDRIWPRGISKSAAEIDIWAKDLAPSGELRKWYRHDHEKWEEFVRRYELELAEQQDAIESLLEAIEEDVVTLVYSCKETQLNNATAFKQHLQRQLVLRA